MTRAGRRQRGPMIAGRRGAGQVETDDAGALARRSGGNLKWIPER